MKQLVSALVICGALAGLGHPFLAHWYGVAAHNAAPAAVAEDRAPPEVGSGKVTDYVRPDVRRLPRDDPERIRLLRWCVAEGAKINAKSPSLWRRAEVVGRERLATLNLTAVKRYAADVAALRETAEGSEQLVWDVVTLAWGAALLKDERLAELERNRAEPRQRVDELTQQFERAKAVAAKDGAPPKVGSGKVAAYLFPKSSNPAIRDAATRQWAMSETARIKADWPALYEGERALAEDLGPNLNVYGQRLNRLIDAAAPRASKMEVVDGMSLLLFLRDRRESDARARRAPAAAWAPQPHPNAIAKSIRQANRAGWNQQGAAWVAQPQPSAPAPSYYGNGSPYPNYVPVAPGPFFENVSHLGNQTSINGVGPFGPFFENISRNGNQTTVWGGGPFGPFNESINHLGNQTNVSGFGLPYPIVPYGGYGANYGYAGYGGGY